VCSYQVEPGVLVLVGQQAAYRAARAVLEIPLLNLGYRIFSQGRKESALVERPVFQDRVDVLPQVALSLKAVLVFDSPLSLLAHGRPVCPARTPPEAAPCRCPCMALRATLTGFPVPGHASALSGITVAPGGSGDSPYME
jgi:hypothetical protein